MSASEEIEMKCPRCGAQQVAKVWKKLDASAEPGIKEALFAWEINIFYCSSCDLKAQIPVGLLYFDPVKKFAVQLYPMDALGSDEFYDGFTQDGEMTGDNPDANIPEMQGIKPHIVFDMSEMMRYIAFREIAYEKGRQ